MPAMRLILSCLLAWMPVGAVADSYLLMAEEDGCIWCARWDEEVSVAYPKTAEGRAAPLVRYDIRSAPPEPVDFRKPVRFTPTFILVKDGEEVGRIEGYPGEEFFWGMLGQIMERADIELDRSG